MSNEKDRSRTRRFSKMALLAVATIAVVVLVLGAIAYPRFRRDMDVARARLTQSRVMETTQGIIEYATSGSGSPVLLLHGAGGGFDQGSWIGRVTLDGGHQMISVSRYGFLRTPIPADATIKGEAALYAALLDELGVRSKVLVAGFSAGGPSAMQFCADYPDRCSGLILLSAVSTHRAADDQSSFVVGIVNLIQRSDFAYWATTKALRSTFLAMIGIRRDTQGKFTPEQQELAGEVLEVMHPMSPRHAGTINDGRMLRGAVIPMGRITAPTLILHARDDGLVGFAHAENSHRGIKQSRLVAFPTGGHGLLPRLAEVRAQIATFVEETRRAARAVVVTPGRTERGEARLPSETNTYLSPLARASRQRGGSNRELQESWLQKKAQGAAFDLCADDAIIGRSPRRR